MKPHFAAFAVTLTLLVMPAALGQLANDDCLSCHETVDATKFSASVHAPLECMSCHADITEAPHETKPGKVDCASCHTDAVAAWDTSLHAKAVKSGKANGARCLDCHGSPHAILPQSDPASPTSHKNIPQTCARCHALKFAMDKVGLSTQSALSYQQSIHGRAVANGNSKAAVCTDCHESHAVLPANDPKSGIFKFNVARTCGTCHSEVAAEFTTSVHGKALARGNWRSPVCTDCHGIHNIKSHIDPSASVAKQNLARTACGQCHGNVNLTSEFGLSAGRVRSYEESYHGLANRLGSSEAANCASCHGVHHILSASDPKSTIHKSNLTQTCGKCHPGSSKKFIEGRVHLEEIPGREQEVGDKVRMWVTRIYIPLIVLTLGGMALHNIIIWVRKARRARKDARRTIVRMNRRQRIQHFFLLTSFFALVITGFALAWPTSFLATITGAETIRRMIHRAAAVVMIAVGIYHVFYMTCTREGRKGLRDFWFRIKDVSDVIGVMKYQLGFSKTHPKMGRFTYAEKAEYWALVWGTIVMGLTGLMLWFEVQVAGWLDLPRWAIDVAVLIHYYEAILATLAIIIWHLYAVIFDPDVYPLNWAWLDGKMRDDHYRHEHEEHYEELQARGHDEDDATV